MMKYRNNNFATKSINMLFIFIRVTFLLGVVFSNNLNAENIVNTEAEDEKDSAMTVVKNTEGSIRQHLSDDYHGQSQLLLDLIEESISPHVDFEGITRLSVGKYWKELDDSQKQSLVKEVRRMLIRSYISALASYNGQEIKYLPVEAQSRPDDALVRTEIIGATGKEASVDYRLHNKHGNWKVYDVISDGISVVMSQRTSFQVILKLSGVNVLIKELARLNNAEIKIASNL